MVSLAEMRPGVSAFVAGVEAEDALLRRLLDIGLTPGTQVLCLFGKGHGGPKVYEIRGAMIAIRREDALRVRMVGDDLECLREMELGRGLVCRAE